MGLALSALTAAAVAESANDGPSPGGPARRPATVTFSDGTALSGQARIMGTRPLTLVPLGEKRQRLILDENILVIEHAVEKASLEKPWTFKEAGKPEKVYFDGEYPLLNFLTTVRLVEGTALTGHLVSAIYLLDTGAATEKVFLPRQIKGELGQGIEEIMYVSRLQFSEQKAVAARRLSGTVTGCGALREVTALDLERLQVLTARVNGEAFDFGNVLPGRYDLCLLTDSLVLAGFSDATPSAAGSGKPLADEDPAAIARLFPLADDFFSDRWILATAGHQACAKTLIYKRREKYFNSDHWTPGGWMWHLEVWSWHRPETEWKVDRRHLFVRHKQQGGETVRRLFVVKALGAVEPGVPLTVGPPPSAEPHEDWQFVRDLD